MKNKKVIGIDLASSQSVVAVIENGKPEVVVNAEGSRTTPSVIMIKDGERKVGGSAKRQAIMNPKNTITYIKRYMGNKYNDEDVQKMIKMSTYKVVDEDNNPRIEINGRKYSPEELSSYILAYMKKTAEDYYGTEVKDAVITCPAYYNDSQRQAVKLAGELAGLNVLRIINEPTAAILAADIDIKKGDKIVMVVDCGGATTDVTIAELSDVDGQLMVEVLSSFGDVFLGGQNYDNALVNYIADEFAKDHSNVDLRKDPMAYSRLIEAAEKAKCELSNSTETDINLPYITVIDNVPQMLVMKLTRSKFEQITKEFTDKLIGCAIESLKKANKTKSDLSEILLVGGSTRIPAIQEALSKEFNVPLDKSVNPDEAVALGAAKQANILVGGDNSGDLLLLDVTPISLGIETEGSVMTKLIDANTTIPTKKSQIFSTAVDNQSAVSLVILQGERPMAKDNKVIGRFDLDGIAPARRGVPQIEVTFDIDANGILKVSAVDKATNKEQHITIQNQNALSQEEIDRIKGDAEKYKEEDNKKKEEIKKFNEIEGYSYAVENSLNDDNFSKIISEDNKKEINKKLEKLKETLKNRNLNDAENAQEELKKVYDPIISNIYKQTQNNQNTNSSKDNSYQNNQQNNDDVQEADFEEVK